METQTNKYQVLVVDDERDIVVLAIILLAREFSGELGHVVEGIDFDADSTVNTVVAAINAKLAIALESGLRSVVLLDGNLGQDILGSEVFARLSAGTPVLVCSGSTEGIYETYSVITTGGTYIGSSRKPIDYKDVAHRIRRHFDPALSERVEVKSQVDAFETLAETITALKGYADSLKEPVEGLGFIPAKGQTILKKTLGFVENTLGALIDPSDLSEETRRLRVKTHAIRNSLAILLGRVSLVIYADPAQGKTSTIQILELIIQVLEEDTKVASNPMPTTLNELFVTFTALGASIRGEEYTSVLAAHVNIPALRLILLNMLANAQAIGAETTVNISIMQDETNWTILINDNGPALPSDFFEAGDTPETGRKGNGARHMLNIAREQGWTLESGDLKGAKFTLKIPKK